MAAKMDRRTFISGAAAGTVVVLKPSIVFGTKSNSKIELGLIGCGGCKGRNKIAADGGAKPRHPARTYPIEPI